MERLFRFFALSAIATFFTLPALSQITQPQSGSTTQAVRSEEAAKYALELEFAGLYKVDQTTAYKIAKEYLQKYPQETEQTKYLKVWVVYYEAREKRLRKQHFGQLLEEKRFDEAFSLGNEILTSEPEDLDTLYNLTMGGLNALIWDNNKAFVADAYAYGKKALALIESGQAADKERLLGQLNYALGILTLNSAPAAAVTYFNQARRLAIYNRDAETYAFIADAILGAEYIPLQKEYQVRFDSIEKKTSPQGQAARVKLNLVIDRIIDALARAVAIAGSDAKFAQVKVQWMKNLTDLYKFRNSGYDTGLSEYIEEILDKPSPP